MSDTEKVSFNLTAVDLGQVDLLINQGFYTSRTDFMVTAVRNLLMKYATAVKEQIARQAMVVGVYAVARKTLEGLLAAGKQLEITVVGVLVLSKDITPELALATIKSLKVFGTLRASSELKDALRERIQ